jgi:hypothetical protein
MNNRTKFASCLARQAALNAGLASAVTRKISTNLMIDRKDPITKKSFRDILMAIALENRPGTTLFHTIDRQFKSDIIVNFQFHPENALEANNLIAGLVPYLRDHGHNFHLKMFTPEALQRQAKSEWNRTTREADSETDAELANLLAEDDDLNFTDEPTMEKVKATDIHQDEPNHEEAFVSVQVPNFSAEHMPSMNLDEDSVSTFHHGNTINLEEDPVSDEEKSSPINSQKTPVSILRTPFSQEVDVLLKISMSDSATRISSLETEFSMLGKQFRDEICKLQSQAAKQADTQLEQSSMLSEILSTLKKINLSTLMDNQSPKRSEVANPPQTAKAGGSPGVAGHG